MPPVLIHFSLLLLLTSSLPSQEGIGEPVSITVESGCLCWCFEKAAFTSSTDSVFSELTWYHKTLDFFLILGSYAKYFLCFCFEEFYSKALTNQMCSFSVSWVMPNMNLINSPAQNGIFKKMLKILALIQE